MAQFTIGEHDFLLDGEKVQVISGALHYFRIHPDQWADRIRKARLMGLNTIETYIPWNAHAPKSGEFRTDGGLDLERFLRLVAAEGMHAIVRPGPYICAEWTNGGLPAWLFRDASVKPRSMEPQYLEAVTEYLRQVYEIVAPLQVQHGGPVILVQIENEYGAYGNDKQYLETLVATTRAAGIHVPLTTVDQPTDLADGGLPGVHRTASFGSRSVERLATLREHQRTGPLMCSEFWNGWFDSWGQHHHTTPVEDSAADLDAILRVGGSVNLYMFHGGTNFGVTNGANDKGTYVPIVTSYDYDSPLDESGAPTAKYFAFRDVISRYAPVPELQETVSTDAPTATAHFDGSAALFDIADSIGLRQDVVGLPTFDDLEFDGALAIYTTTLAGGGVLTFAEVRDRASVYVDGASVGILSRENHERAIVLPASARTLTVVVEDQGRVNYGIRLGEHKGLIGPAALDGVELTDWTVTTIDLTAAPDVALRPGVSNGDGVGPRLVRAEVVLDEPHDLFLDTAGWGKGFAWVNGFFLGRYWQRGPQRTLFVPAPVTRAGSNEVRILELDVLASLEARLLATPSLGQTEY